MPERHQLSRQKGYRKPRGAVVITRCGWCAFCAPQGRRGESGWSRRPCFGNPFTVATALEVGYATTPEEAARMCAGAFDSWLRNPSSSWAFAAGIPRREWLLGNLDLLRGRDVACVCALDQPCHGDTYLDLANR